MTRILCLFHTLFGNTGWHIAPRGTSFAERRYDCDTRRWEYRDLPDDVREEAAAQWAVR